MYMYFFFFSQNVETKDGPLLLDYSKNLVNDDVLKMLFDLVCNILCFIFSQRILRNFLFRLVLVEWKPFAMECSKAKRSTLRKTELSST